MSRITDYKVIQADGVRELAKEVKRFIAEGWEPHGSVILVGTKGPIVTDGETVTPLTRIYAQPMVKREPEHAEIERLRELERLAGQIDNEIDVLRDTIPADNLLAYVQELLAKALRGGPYERRG